MKDDPTSAQRNSLMTGYLRNLDAPIHSMLGLGALVTEMAKQGASASELLVGTKLTVESLTDPAAHMSHRQKIAIFRNVSSLTQDPT
ncbi:MAG: hypothetical protein ACHP7O_04270, partial [Burkholderiales bacterium]